MAHGKIPLMLSGVLCLFLVSTKLSAHCVNPRFGGATPAKADPSKAADIHRLLDLVGTKQIVVQMMRNMEAATKQSFGTMLERLLEREPPSGERLEEILDVFMQKWKARGAEGGIEKIVPIYDRHFSHEEIRGLIQFYETPLGRRSIELIPQITQESMAAGQEWATERILEVLREMAKDFPELRQIQLIN